MSLRKPPFLLKPHKTWKSSSCSSSSSSRNCSNDTLSFCSEERCRLTKSLEKPCEKVGHAAASSARLSEQRRAQRKMTAGGKPQPFALRSALCCRWCFTTSCGGKTSNLPPWQKGRTGGVRGREVPRKAAKWSADVAEGRKVVRDGWCGNRGL